MPNGCEYVKRDETKLTTSPFHACSSHADASPATRDMRHRSLRRGSYIEATARCLQRFHPSHNGSLSCHQCARNLSSRIPQIDVQDHR